MIARRRRPAAADPRMRPWTTRKGKRRPPTGATWTRTSVASSARVGRSGRASSGVRQRSVPADAPLGGGGARSLATGRARDARDAGISTRRRGTATCALRIHRPAQRRTARPRLPAWRRLDALQHRYPRPGDARVRGARRLLRDRRRLRAVARAASFRSRSSRSSTSCAGSRSRAPRSASTRRRLAIGGDSAGANLSVAACLVRRDLQSAPPLARHGPQLRRVRSRTVPRKPAAATAARNTCSAARR